MKTTNYKSRIINATKRKLSSLVTSHPSLRSGFGLIEIIIVTAIVTIALFGFSQSSVVALKLLRAEKENLGASLLAGEALEAVRALRDESWSNNIAPSVNGVFYYPVIENSKWKLDTTAPLPINGKYSRYVIFDQVLRDQQDKISSSGTPDPSTRKVTARVINGNKISELITYLTNYQESLGGSSETKSVYFEDATTDADLSNFPSNNSGNGDSGQSFTTLSSSLSVTKVELYLKRTTSVPSNIYVELRSTAVGTVLGVSNTIVSGTISSSALSWVEFRFPSPVNLSATTKYYLRLRSNPSSTDAGSGSAGTLNWGYRQTSQSPYSGGDAIRYIGRLSNPSDPGQVLDQYDFGFRVYALQ